MTTYPCCSCAECVAARDRMARVRGMLQRARAALVYHVAQTRPIQATQDVVDAIDACLSEHGGA